jgi:hypothetical protein
MASTGSNSTVERRDGPAAQAGVVVGLTSYRDGQAIDAVLGPVQQGLSRYPGSDARIVLAAPQPAEGTPDAERARVPAAIIPADYSVPAAFTTMPYHGHPGRAAALRAVLVAAQRLGATGCAVLDAAVTTMTPEWIDRLIEPVVNGGFDYVSPYFARRVNEGMITKAIVYPMVRALDGVRIRQPVAAEFGCSAAVLAHFLDQDFWDHEQADTGIDLWLALAAARGGFQICEASLGVRATSRETPADVRTALAQVVGALFADVEHRAEVWQRTRNSVPLPIVGRVPDVESPLVEVDALIESFRLGYRELREIWTWVLPPRAIIDLRQLADAPIERFRFDDRLWATILYDFALGYSLRVMPQDHLLGSLTPIYNGWMASFVAQLNGAPLPRVEERIEQVCLAFEAEKRYLISRWRWPERLR